MEKQPLIPIVVPVYNVENYLEECVVSLAEQTYENIEIILVDDGTPDRSGELCDVYAASNPRITAYHKENGGLSDARNFGLRHSQGEWVAFIDSDDYISPAFIETLYNAAARFDCPLAAVSGGHDFKDGTKCFLILDPAEVEPARLLSSSEYEERMLYQRVRTGVQWRLYRRDILGEDPFPVGLYYEDLASTYKFVFKSKQVALVECNDLYAYRHRPDSIVREDFKPIKAESVLLIAKQLYDDVGEMWPELKSAASVRCFAACRTVFAQIPIGSNSTSEHADYRQKIWGVLARHRKTVLCDRMASKKERLAALIACSGIRPFTLFCVWCRRLGLIQ